MKSPPTSAVLELRSIPPAPDTFFESRELFEKDEFDAADRAVALLADDDLGYVLFFGFGFVDLFAVDEHHDVGVLLNRIVNEDVTATKL